jgi:hypothetical protein
VKKQKEQKNIIKIPSFAEEDGEERPYFNTREDELPVSKKPYYHYGGSLTDKPPQSRNNQFICRYIPRGK